MIGTDDLRFLMPAPTGMRGTVAAALLLSAAGHIGAVMWAVSGEPATEITTSAGGSVVLEVTLIEGPEQGTSAAAAPAPDKPNAKDAARREAGVSPDTNPSDHATNADRDPHAALPAEDDFAIVLPASVAAAPVPPPKPSRSIPDKKVSPVSRETLPDSLPMPAPAPEAAGPFAKEYADEPPVKAVPEPGEAGQARAGISGAAPRADNRAPPYPATARRRGQEGRVLLLVEVLPGGTAGTVRIEQSSGVASLDQAALEAVQRWRFRPAQRNGQPVAATVQVPIRFALN